MAINSKRRAISHMVYGALPPHSTNVLWMDTSVPELPVCKIFWNGCWTSVHTDDSKEIELLAKAVEELSSTTQSQENTIAQLSEQILVAIQAIDLSGVATEENATTNKEAILTAVSNLQTALQGSDSTATLTALKEAIALLPTVSAIQNGLAKETSVEDGNDTAISVGKEVRSEVGTGSDTASESGTLFAVVKWVKDKVKSIYNAVTDSADGLGAISTKMNAVVSLIVDKTIEGVTLFDPVPLSFLGIMTNRRKVAGIEDNTIVRLECTEQGLLNTLFPACKVITINNCIYYGGQSFFIWSDSVEEIYLPEVVEVTCAYSFHRAYKCKKIIMPKCSSISGGTAFQYSDVLEHLNILNLNSGFHNLTFTSPNLIDLETGAGFTGNVNINSWSPTNALSSSSSSLVESGETFVNNLEKLLYNIREHIAANLPDRTGLSALTITFSSAVKAAINADTATAQAFSNKNWTIA